MSNERYKLHPISAIINFVKGIKELIIPIVIVLFTRFFSKTAGGIDFWSQLFPILVVVVLSVLYLFSGIVKWWTFRYWFEDEELRVKYGLIVKKKKFIPFERIQSFNYKEGIFHRFFGLVEVKVETAGGTFTPEVVLTAITKEAAERIEAITQKVKEKQQEQCIAEETLKVNEPKLKVIHNMATKDLLILATTSNSIGVVITGILAVYSQFSEYIPYDLLFDELQSLIKNGIIFITFLLFIAFFISWIISVFITFFKYYDFKVLEQNEHLIITHGLIEKKKITIPLNRVQAIKIIENPIREFFGFATVVVESAGGGFEEKDQKINLFPLISKRKMYHPLNNLFPQFDLKVPMIRPSKKGRPFFYRKDFFWMIPSIMLCLYFFYPYGIFSCFLLPVIILLRIWQYKTTGIAKFDNQLVIVYRFINKVTFIAEKKRIQVIESQQSFFQRRKNISSVEAHVMSNFFGTSAKAIYIDEEVVDDVMKWFER